MSGRLWVLAGVLLAFGITAIGWFIGASPLLAQASANEAQLADIEAQNAAQMIEIATMKEQFENLEELEERLDELQISVPGFADTGDFFDEVAANAGAAGVSLQTVTVEGALPYGAMGSTETSTDPAPAGDDAAGETTDATTESDAVPTADLLPPPTVPGAGLAQDLYVMKIGLEIDADENQLAAFLAALQGDGRLMLITQVESSFGVSQRSSITAYIFIVHDPRLGPVGSLPTPAPAESADPEPAVEPDATPTPDPDATPDPSPTPTATP